MVSCRESLTGSTHQVKGHDTAAPQRQEATMPKYLLLKHYRGGPAPHRPVPPMDQWAPEDVEAHMAFLGHVRELLKEKGEYVDAQALAPAQTWVRYGGPDAAPVTTDGPLPENSDLVAGWYMVDVESHARASSSPPTSRPSPAPAGRPCTSGSTSARSCPARRRAVTRRDRRADATATAIGRRPVASANSTMRAAVDVGRLTPRRGPPAASASRPAGPRRPARRSPHGAGPCARCAGRTPR